MPVKNHIIPDERAQEVTVAEADRVADPFTLVLFGASGDLTQRMIMPAIFRLARRGLLPPQFRLIGHARSKMTDDEFRYQVDEHQWLNDPEVDEYAPNPYGEENSVVIT